MSSHSSAIATARRPAVVGQDRKTPTQFVARQPIFDREQNVVGYELLFRAGLDNYFPGVNKDAASRSVIDQSLLVGIDVLCEGQKAFVNCTRDVLVNQLVTVLPPDSTVIEVVEDVEVSEEVIAACRKLRSAGHMIALDDFVPGGPCQKLLDLANVIKVDVRAVPLADQRRVITENLRSGTWLLAEKVETKEDFDSARALGFTHFQGFFFAQPVVLGLPELRAESLNRIRMLQCMAAPELDSSEVEGIVKSDPALCYRLLRYLNSPLFALSCNVNSVRHTLALMGECEIRRWVMLMVAVAAVEDKPVALLRLALVRARFCQSLATLSKWRGNDLFLLGLFSLMDTILGMSMAQLLRRVRLSEPLQQALLGHHTGLGRVIRLVRAYESADWALCTELASALGVNESALTNAYLEAVTWTKEFARIAGLAN